MTDYRIPRPEEFLKPIEKLEAELPDALRDEEAQEIRDKQASNAWRALRVARSHDIRLFSDKVAGGNLQAFLNVSLDLEHPHRH